MGDSPNKKYNLRNLKKIDYKKLLKKYNSPIRFRGFINRVRNG